MYIVTCQHVLSIYRDVRHACKRVGLEFTRVYVMCVGKLTVTLGTMFLEKDFDNTVGAESRELWLGFWQNSGPRQEWI